MTNWNYREIKWEEGMFELPRPNGRVLEHREVAARAIERALGPSECVHHMDENKSNNSPDNLMVFSTQADHIRFHRGGQLVPNGDETFRCMGISRLTECPKCGGSIGTAGKEMCQKCRFLDNAKHIPDADELHDLVWRMPTTQVAEMFGVSDSAIAKWCKKRQIEKPPRGYWTGRSKSPCQTTYALVV